MGKNRDLLKLAVFFIGWLLSPLTWWNDAFINVPLSYLIASIIFYAIRIPFGRLLIAVYWCTNILGLGMMFFSGRDIILSSKNKLRSAILFIITLAGYTMLIILLDRWGRLMPLGEFLRSFIR
jgi:hypothetical protein